MDFSVIIAVRNEIQYIEKCIYALFNQDYKGTYEVLIIDGMSNDGTYELLQKLNKKYNFSLLQNPVLNAAAGRNTGIKKAKGNIIAFIDGDAIASKDWLTQLKKCFSKGKKNIAGIGGPDHFPDDSTNRSKLIGYIMTSPLSRGGKFNPSTQHSLLEEEKFVDHIPTCNLAIKREIFDKVGLFDEDFVKGQDLELNYRIRDAGFKLLYSPKVKVVHYRKHHTKDFANQIYKWAKAKIAIIKKHGMHGLVSHVYLWPVYFIAGIFCIFLLFYFTGFFQLFLFLLFSGFIFYITVILLESAQLSLKYKNRLLFWFAALYFPIVHISYSWGVFASLLKKRIW
jgi:GT2 family glycosyltransferase